MTYARPNVIWVKPEKILSCVLVLAASSAGLSAQRTESAPASAVPTLSPPSRTASYFFAAPKEATAPFFSHGYLLQFIHHSTFAGNSNIYLYNSSGQLEHEVAVWPAGTAKLYLTSVDVGVGRQLVFAGEATRGDGTKFAFIATSSLDGTGQQYFGTGDYRASQIAQADDGSIWSVGADKYEVVDPTSAAPLKWNNYDVLRHYSSAGKLLEHFLPRWGTRTAYVIKKTDASNNVTLHAYDAQNNPLAEYVAPLWGPQGGYAMPMPLTSQSWLKAVHNGVVLYDGRSGALYCYGVSNSTLSRQGVELGESQGRTIDGFAASGDGRIFASFRNSDATNHFALGVFELRIPNSEGEGLARWTRIPRDASSQVLPGRLLGSDGSAIVYRSGNQVMWSEVSQ